MTFLFAAFFTVFSSKFTSEMCIRDRCIVGCSQTKDSDNHVVQDYSEEYEVSPYGSEEALDTLDDLKISMSTEKDLDLKHLSFLIENTSDKEYRYSPNYFEIEAEQSGTWYQLEQLDDPSKSNDCLLYTSLIKSFLYFGRKLLCEIFAKF